MTIFAMSKQNNNQHLSSRQEYNTATKDMTNLAQQVNDIKKAEVSIAAKKRALLKLGITDYECNLILGAEVIAASGSSKSYTFGVEIECLVPRDTIISAAQRNGVKIAYEGYNHRDNKSYFKFVTDASIHGANPIECVSPVLSSRGGMKKLEAACKSLNEANAAVNKSTGLHVHIGAADLTDEQYINVFVNYQKLEGVIDSFMARSRRANNNMYAQSMRNYSFDFCRTISDVRREIGTRYTKVNAYSYERHNTVEFRQHQGSTDFKKISNWVKFCAKLVEWSKSHRLTAVVNSIDDIEFLSQTEKNFFKSRAEQLG